MFYKYFIPFNKLLFQFADCVLQCSDVFKFESPIYFLIYLNWRLITWQYCNGFCHTLTWISHGCTCVPYPEPSSHNPPHPIPQGHPSALALSTLFHASNLDWWSSSHMVIYMFQCYSLKSSHPHFKSCQQAGSPCRVLWYH